MDGNRRRFSKRQQPTQFKRKGGDRKGKWKNSGPGPGRGREESSRNSHPGDTVYRILCHDRKIGGVIGKGGGIIKGLREETRAKITIADSFPGSDERVIIIYSSPEKIFRNRNRGEGLTMENENGPMEPHCAAQDALLKVNDRIIEEDLSGGVAPDDIVITTRLLVPNNMVGCLLGKRGDVIQRLRSETGANIKVLPPDHLPTCAMNTDELVQISAKPDVARKALYEVSTLLHKNPRKDQSPSLPMPYGGPSFHTPRGPMPNMPPPGNQMFKNRNSSTQFSPPMPMMGGYNNQDPGFRPGGFSSGPPAHGGEPLAEFSMKILCSAGKIGGVIGKGGSNVKLVQQGTGASIHVEDASTESDERVIRVSAFEALWNPRSQAIDAILLLQNEISEISDKGTITTRLLVSSSKVGCIIGQGGQIINEMRRRTQADIRVFSKDEKPKCASEDEELVQISGNFTVAKDALAEIASRLRVRTLRDANTGLEPRHLGPAQGYGPTQNPSGRNPQLSGVIGASSSGGYEAPRVGGLGYESQSYPAPTGTAIRPMYPNPSNAFEPNILGSGVHSGSGAGGISGISEVGPGPRVKLQDGAYENVAEFQGSMSIPPPQFPGQSMNSQQGSYQTGGPGVAYQGMEAQQSPYPPITQQGQGAYPNITAPLAAYPHQVTYPYS